jgi:hypothetical protein
MTDRGVRRLLTTVLCAVLALGCSAPAAAPRHHIAVLPFHTLPRHLSGLDQPPDSGRPNFEAGVSGVVGAARGVLDISLSAAVDGALVVYWSFPGRSFSPGFQLIGGTSEATPLLAGPVAIADQIKGSRSIRRSAIWPAGVSTTASRT